MADALKVVEVYRPKIVDANRDIIDAPFLAVNFVETGTTVSVMATLSFADFAGLEAEWEAGVATTVLNTAIETWVTGGTIQVSDPDTPTSGSGSRGFEYTT